MTLYCQNCGKDTADKPLTFYGNVLCSEQCKKELSERVYFRDTPPEPGSTWFCPHCGASNPLGDPRKELRPECGSCGRPLDPASAAPPRKAGCLGLALLVLLPAGLALIACTAHAAAGPRVAPSPQDVSGPVIAVGPVDAVPRHGPYLHGARFEPPFGRVLHGMGQWEDGNAAYRALLADASIAPASRLHFMPIGDWPRSWESRREVLGERLRQTVAEGQVPNVDFTLYGLHERGEGHVAIDAEIASGDRYDARLLDLVRAIGVVDGPVFVRIGAEFNGHWNGYEPYAYPRAFRRIVGMFRDEGVDNVAFVWCYEPSAPDDFDVRDEDGSWRWYPGDDVVDWFGIDLFDASQFRGSTGRRGVLSQAGRTEAFLRMALRHGKPVMLAEVSAARVDITPDAADGRLDWEGFFGTLFEFLDRNPNVMAFNYINVDWTAVGEYARQGWKDARLERNEWLAGRYRERLAGPRFLHADGVSELNGWSPPGTGSGGSGGEALPLPAADGPEGGAAGAGEPRR